MSNLLKEIRTEKGLSQLGLAKLTNISPSDISRVENGWLRPYPGWRKRFAKALNTPVDKIFPCEVAQDGK